MFDEFANRWWKKFSRSTDVKLRSLHALLYFFSSLSFAAPVLFLLRTREGGVAKWNPALVLLATRLFVWLVDYRGKMCVPTHARLFIRWFIQMLRLALPAIWHHPARLRHVRWLMPKLIYYLIDIILGCSRFRGHWFSKFIHSDNTSSSVPSECSPGPPDRLSAVTYLNPAKQNRKTTN